MQTTGPENVKNKALKDYLATFISSHKIQRMEEVLSQRTRMITVVIEDVHKSHNASAVIRNCDVAGVQNLHIIENLNKYKVNPYVTRGASQWVDIFRYNTPGEENTSKCYKKLKEEGYKIYATTPSVEGIRPDEVDLNEKVALVFGNEFSGLSTFALENANNLINIPMYGFTESYNISVTAAICLYNLTQRLRQSSMNWQLSLEEKEEIKLKWYKKVVKRAALHTKLFLSK